jgi:hypothetical protein
VRLGELKKQNGRGKQPAPTIGQDPESYCEVPALSGVDDAFAMSGVSFALPAP